MAYVLARAGDLSRRPARARASRGIVLLHQSLGRRDGMGGANPELPADTRAAEAARAGNCCGGKSRTGGGGKWRSPGRAGTTGAGDGAPHLRCRARPGRDGHPRGCRARRAQGPAASRGRAGTGTLKVAACGNPSALPPPRASTPPAPTRGGRSTRPLQGHPDRGGEQLRPAPEAAGQPPACVARPSSQEPSAAGPARAFALSSASYSRLAVSRPLWNTSRRCRSASLRPFAVRR